MTRDELLRTIAEAPDDDGPREVYADWLEERGDPAGARAIRDQLTAERDRDDDLPSDHAIVRWADAQRRVEADEDLARRLPEGALLSMRRGLPWQLTLDELSLRRAEEVIAELAAAMPTIERVRCIAFEPVVRAVAAAWPRAAIALRVTGQQVFSLPEQVDELDLRCSPAVQPPWLAACDALRALTCKPTTRRAPPDLERLAATGALRRLVLFRGPDWQPPASLTHYDTTSGWHLDALPELRELGLRRPLATIAPALVDGSPRLRRIGLALRSARDDACSALPRAEALRGIELRGRPPNDDWPQLHAALRAPRLAGLRLDTQAFAYPAIKLLRQRSRGPGVGWLALRMADADLCDLIAARPLRYLDLGPLPRGIGQRRWGRVRRRLLDVLRDHPTLRLLTFRDTWPALGHDLRALERDDLRVLSRPPATEDHPRVRLAWPEHAPLVPPGWRP